MNGFMICLITCLTLCKMVISGAVQSSSNGEIKYGVSISGHTILSLDKFGMKTCAKECKHTTRCKSIDFDRKNFVCELKSKMLKEAHADIVQNPWTWHLDMENLTTDVSTCTNKVCKTDEKCLSGICVFSECPSFPSIENAYLLPSTTRTCGPTRTYKCFDGSIESGNPNITLSFNVWTPTTFKCHCPGLPSVKNANLLPSITRSCGPTRTFQCSDGFIGSGNPNITLSFNVWTPTTFKCHKTFGDWILLARFKRGIGISAYNTWLSSGTSSEVDTSVEEGCTSMNCTAICTKHYRSGLIDEWYTLGVTEELEEALSEHFGAKSHVNLSTIETDEDQCLVSDFAEENEISVNNEVLFVRAMSFMSNLGCTNETEVDNNPEQTEISECDIEAKYNAGCCAKDCLRQFDFNKIKQNILSLRELLKSEKEMLLMGVLKESNSSFVGEDQRKRARYDYHFKGRVVCFRAFLVIYDITRFSLQALQAHVQKNGYSERVHGNTGKRPHNAFTYDEIKHAAQFLLNYADINGIPQPVGSRWQDVSPPIFLPCGDTKYSIHKTYVDACENSSVRSLGLSSFKDLWLQVLPHIKISSPRTDVCQKCETFRKDIKDAVDDDDKIELVNNFSDHLRRAQEGKERYRTAVSESVNEFKDVVRGYGPISPLSSNYTKVHYTFDFSQQMLLPHHARQMGPIYFAVPRKIQLFGVRVDGVPRQYNYLIDEDQTIGSNGSGTHGPNAVISMLHHALENFGYGEQECIIHADNCVGQNKNRFLMAYFSWRTQKQLHRQITYFMQIPGHTRCLVDSNFAHIKKLYRRKDSESLEQLREIVDTSSFSNNAVLYAEEPSWMWRDWKTFLNMYFRQINRIAKFYSFRFHVDSPGLVFVRQSNEPEIAVDIKKAVELPDTLPREIEPAGISFDRQQYLFRHVRQFVRDPWKDATCPRPTPVGEE